MNNNKDMELNNQIYGNPTLGMASKYLRVLLGDELLFEIFKEFHKYDKDKFPIIEPDSFRRMLDSVMR